MQNTSNLVLRNQDVNLRLKRMAWEILEQHYGAKSILLAGVADRGFELAKRLQEKLEKISDLEINATQILIDKEKPYGQSTEIKNLESFTAEHVVVIDDVLNSGKTLIYALQPFLSKPLTKLSTLVLVERSHNRYPVKADIVGLSLSTTLQEHVDVVLGDEDAVYLR